MVNAKIITAGIAKTRPAVIACAWAWHRKCNQVAGMPVTAALELYGVPRQNSKLKTDWFDSVEEGGTGRFHALDRYSYRALGSAEERHNFRASDFIPTEEQRQATKDNNAASGKDDNAACGLRARCPSPPPGLSD